MQYVINKAAGDAHLQLEDLENDIDDKPVLDKFPASDSRFYLYVTTGESSHSLLFHHRSFIQLSRTRARSYPFIILLYHHGLFPLITVVSAFSTILFIPYRCRLRRRLRRRLGHKPRHKPRRHHVRSTSRFALQHAGTPAHSNGKQDFSKTATFVIPLTNKSAVTRLRRRGVLRGNSNTSHRETVTQEEIEGIVHPSSAFTDTVRAQPRRTPRRYDPIAPWTTDYPPSGDHPPMLVSIISDGHATPQGRCRTNLPRAHRRRRLPPPTRDRAPGHQPHQPRAQAWRRPSLHHQL